MAHTITDAPLQEKSGKMGKDERSIKRKLDASVLAARQNSRRLIKVYEDWQASVMKCDAIFSLKKRNDFLTLLKSFRSEWTVLNNQVESYERSMGNRVSNATDDWKTLQYSLDILLNQNWVPVASLSDLLDDTEPLSEANEAFFRDFDKNREKN